MASTHSLDIVTTILDADTLRSPPPCARGSRPRRLAQSADSPPTRHLHATPQMHTAGSQAYANATSAVLQGPRHRLCGIFRCGIFASWCGGGGGNCGCRGADGGSVAAADGVCVRERACVLARLFLCAVYLCSLVSLRSLRVLTARLPRTPRFARFPRASSYPLLPPSHLSYARIARPKNVCVPSHRRCEHTGQGCSSSCSAIPQHVGAGSWEPAMRVGEGVRRRWMAEERCWEWAGGGGCGRRRV